MKAIKIIIIVLLLAVLILGAYVLYNRLAPMVGTSQLATEAPAATTPDGSESPEEERTLAADFKTYDIDGNEYMLSDFRGKPVILNFWASWCGPCQMEMPDFQKKYEQYGEDINFLIVNMTDGVRETVEVASKFIEGTGYTFPVYYDAYQEAAVAYRVTSLPTTYFIDAEGYLVAQGRGALNEEVLQSGIDLLLDGK